MTFDYDGPGNYIAILNKNGQVEFHYWYKEYYGTI